MARKGTIVWIVEERVSVSTNGGRISVVIVEGAAFVSTVNANQNANSVAVVENAPI
jgi:hypothetical protein